MCSLCAQFFSLLFNIRCNWESFYLLSVYTVAIYRKFISTIASMKCAWIRRIEVKWFIERFFLPFLFLLASIVKMAWIWHCRFGCYLFSVCDDNKWQLKFLYLLFDKFIEMDYIDVRLNWIGIGAILLCAYNTINCMSISFICV